jgi:hypothetical protein
MPSNIETIARRIVDDVGRPRLSANQWATLADVAERLGIDGTTTEEAAALAVEKGWIELERGQRIDLTDKGRGLLDGKSAGGAGA